MPKRHRIVARALILSLTALLLVLQTPIARADGMAFKPRDMTLRIPVREREQIAVIDHENGREALTIAINIQETEDEMGLAYDEDAVWIFPVRGQPDDISIDIEASLPKLGGTRLEYAAEQGLSRLLLPAYATQVYPLCAFCLCLPALGRARGVPATALHDEIEKLGLRCQLVTSDSLAGLGEWLERQDTPIPGEHLQSFESYLDEEHALVVVSIASMAEIEANFSEAFWGRLRGRWPCVRVEFPSEDAFYPMIPTSGYGEESIGCRLYIKGLVDFTEPVAYGDSLRITHVLADRPKSGGVTTFGDYTVVRGDVVAANLTEDLTFRPAASAQLSGRVLEHH